MSSLYLPIGLTLIGLLIAGTAYRNIRRGAARYYTLEREALLKQAGYTMLASILFLLSAIALLVYGNQQLQIEQAVEAGETVENVPTPQPTLGIFPPTSTPPPISAEETTVPTPIPTPSLRRALVDGTGVGLYLREFPGGPEVETLADGSPLTVLDDEPQQFNGATWLKVRTITQQEGWVVQDFLIIQDR